MGSLLAAACDRTASRGEATQSTSAKPAPLAASGARAPAIFLAHGAPPTLDDAEWMKAFASWSAAMPRPKAILMVSAHWTSAPTTLGATRTMPLVYDFYGFPRRYYEVTYPAPGAPELAARLDVLLGGGTRRIDRGLDHGAFVPLMGMYPAADVPVLTMSLPTLEPAALFDLGKKVAPLRDEGVLIVGSGFLTHNLSRITMRGDAEVPAYAREFDEWVERALVKGDVDTLLAYREKAPAVAEVLPTHEHFVPLLVAMGAGLAGSAPPTFPIEGFVFGPLSRRSVQWG